MDPAHFRLSNEESANVQPDDRDLYNIVLNGTTSPSDGGLNDSRRSRSDSGETSDHVSSKPQGPEDVNQELLDHSQRLPINQGQETRPHTAEKASWSLGGATARTVLMGISAILDVFQRCTIGVLGFLWRFRLVKVLTFLAAPFGLLAMLVNPPDPCQYTAVATSTWVVTLAGGPDLCPAFKSLRDYRGSGSAGAISQLADFVDVTRDVNYITNLTLVMYNDGVALHRSAISLTSDDTPWIFNGDAIVSSTGHLIDSLTTQKDHVESFSSLVETVCDHTYGRSIRLQSRIDDLLRWSALTKNLNLFLASHFPFMHPYLEAPSIMNDLLVLVKALHRETHEMRGELEAFMTSTSAVLESLAEGEDQVIKSKADFHDQCIENYQRYHLKYNFNPLKLPYIFDSTQSSICSNDEFDKQIQMIRSLRTDLVQIRSRVKILQGRQKVAQRALGKTVKQLQIQTDYQLPETPSEQWGPLRPESVFDLTLQPEKFAKELAELARAMHVSLSEDLDRESCRVLEENNCSTA